MAGDERPRRVATRAKKSGCAKWAIGGAAVAVALIVIGLLAPEGERLEAGKLAVVAHGGAAGAWFACDDDAWGKMIDGQNSGSGALLGTLITAGRAFREPNGSRVRVVRIEMGAALVTVVDGANVENQGWVQREFLAPIQP